MNLNRKKGFSLVELIVVVAIFGMLFVIVSNTFFNSMKAAIKAEALKEVRQNGDVAMARMVYDIRRSSYYQCWADALGRTVLVLYYKTNSDRIGYRWASNKLYRNVVINNLADSDGYILDSKNVLLSDSSDPNIVFSCNTNMGVILTTPVTIDFTLQYVPFGIVANLTNGSLRSEEKIEMRFRTTVVPRNTN